jgi:hypothetical protein
MYRPDNWVVIKINGKNPHYRVIAGWTGGYLQGDSWRLNSGITKAYQEDGYVSFHGASGSSYVCHKDGYGLRNNNAHIYEQLTLSHDVEVVSEDTDWESVDWIL